MLAPNGVGVRTVTLNGSEFGLRTSTSELRIGSEFGLCLLVDPVCKQILKLIIILSKIVSGSVPKSVVIQGFVPDVVVVHGVELVRGQRGVCDSGVSAVPLSRGWLWVVKGVSGYAG